MIGIFSVLTTIMHLFGLFVLFMSFRILMLLIYIFIDVRGLFGKFMKFCYIIVKYRYNPFIFLNITGITGVLIDRLDRTTTRYKI